MKGIYCIENNVNGKKYIGQSTNIENRWKLHRYHLERGTHENSHLQRAWDKYGGSAFRFFVVEELEEGLSDSEMRWIALFNTHGNGGYNLTDGGEGKCGARLTDEQRKHLSTINMGKRNPNYGLKRTAEQRKRLSDALKGKKKKPLTEEHRKKISEKAKLVDHSSQRKRVLWVEKNLTFKSVSEAAVFTGIHISLISAVCNGTLEKTHNYHFIFV